MLTLKNIGKGTAKDIRYKWNNFTGSYDRGVFPLRSLLSGESKTILISFARPRVQADITFTSIDFTYEDLLENTYLQRLLFSFKKQKGEIVLDSFLMCPPYVQPKETTHA